MFSLSHWAANRIATLLGPVVKTKRLDGSAVLTQLRVEEGRLFADSVPDTARLTSVSLDLGEVEGEGQIAVQGERLVAICRRATQDLPISIAEGAVHLGPWQTSLEPEVEIPTIDGPLSSVGRVDFVRAVSESAWAASSDLVRPQLTLIHLGKGYARSCDGLRYQELRVPFDLEMDVSVFTVPLLTRYFQDSSGSTAELLHVQQSPTHQRYSSGGLTVVVPRPAVEYMDLDALIAQPARAHNNFLLRVDRESLLRAVQDAEIMSGEAGIVSLTIESGSLTVSSAEGVHAANIPVPCRWDGEPRILRFFAGPLRQLLRTSSREVVELRLGTSSLRHLTPLVVWEGEKFALLNQVRGR